MKTGLFCKKAVAILAVLVFFSGLSVIAYATNDEIEYVQSQKEEDEKRLVSTEERIAALEASKTSSEAYLEELSRQISDLTNELTDTGDRLSKKEKELADIEEEISRLEAEADDQYEDMKIRIRFLYENGVSSGTFVSMFSADSFTEFLNRAENYSQLNRFDREMLQNYENTLNDIQTQKETLLAEKDEILALKEELSIRQFQVQELYEIAYHEMTDCISELAGAQSEYTALLDELQAQDELLNNLLRQQYEEEVAAELAAQQAALEAAYVPEEYYSEPSPVPEVVPEPDVPYEDNTVPDSTVENVPEVPEEPQESSSEPEITDSPSDTTYLGYFTLTAYCACSKCCGIYASGYTASGTYATEGRTVAMGGIPFGTKLSINGQIYTVEDRGTAYGHVDIFFNSHDVALQFGLQHADVYVVN